MDKRIKVVVIIPNFNRGGAETILVHFANYINKDIFHLTIFCLEKKGELLRSLPDNVDVVDINKPGFYFSIFTIKDQLKKLNADVVIGWIGHINAMLAFTKPYLPKKLILMCRESSIPSRYNKFYRLSFLLNFFYKFYNQFNGIICQSEAMKQDLVNTYKVATDKIKVINNPVLPFAETGFYDPELDDFKEPGDKLLLFVGRFSYEKRVHLCLQAILLLPVNFKLIIIGYGPLEDYVRREINKLQLEKRVLLITNCSNPSYYYKISDCALMTSSFEGFPNVMLEANSYGCPVVVFGTEGGAKEIITSTSGMFISEERGFNDFVSSIKEACSEARFNRFQISRETRNKYNVNTIIRIYEDFIMSTVKSE